MLCDDLEVWDVGGGAQEEEDLYIELWLIHVAEWQKLYHCEAIILQLKNKVLKFLNKNKWLPLTTDSQDFMKM